MEILLSNTSQALVGSENALHLLEQKQRIERAIERKDVALILDSSKALIESCLKTIINDRNIDSKTELDLNPLFKELLSHLDLNRDGNVRELLKRLIGGAIHQIAEIRNKYGAASHGKDGFFDNPIEMPEAEMIAYISDGIVGFLIKKHRRSSDPAQLQRLYYPDYCDFNLYLDSQHQAIDLGLVATKPVPYSVILFEHDKQAYRERLMQFLSPEKDDDDLVVSAPSSPEIVPIAENESPSAVKSSEAFERSPDAALPVDSLYQQVMDILNSHIAQQTNDTLQLDKVAHVISDELASVQNYLDWETREGFHEEVKAKFRILLRRNGFLEQDRDIIASEIMSIKDIYINESGDVGGPQ